MADSPGTRPSLLVRLRDPADGLAWGQFVEIYAPLIYGYGRKRGLQDADAADLTQDVLHLVARSIATWEYDPRRGSFRGWLFTIVRNKLRTDVTRRHRLVRGTGDTGMHELLEQQPSADENESEWDQDYDRRLFAAAGQSVRQEVQETTWKAFWQTAVDGRHARQVASELGMSVAAVYLAKSRVVARLKQVIQAWEG